MHLIQKSDAKLSGRSATIPVTVQNNLVQGVGHLVLRLTSQQPTRLKIGNGPYDERRIQVAGEHSQSVKFTTSTKANGPVQVVAQLYTEDGQPYGDPVPFEVKVTEITSTVMLVIGGGVLLLVLAGFRMYTQRKRAAARKAEEDTANGPEAGATARSPRAPWTLTPPKTPRPVPNGLPARSPGQTTRSSRVTRHRTPHRKAPTRPARVREWTVERCRGRWARGR